jgi:NTP pyrophosphatase (non-canonical NTP hydrolase)
LDIDALQTTLRTFAAERDWEPFHTPKNLSTALMVEAAELAEIFQWMTPEQSREAHTDAVVREHIADEVADVLLYLLQIADHTQVDLKRAVGRKLVKNARKHPPVRTALPAGTAAASTVETHVLVDWENVQPQETALRALVPDATDAWLFHGPNQKIEASRFPTFGSRATPVKISRSGKNALDFHLTFYMGYIAARHPDARFVVVSNDKGYGPMLEHAAELGFSARQIGIDVPKTQAPAPAQKATAKKVAPAARKPVATPAKKAGPAKPKAAARKTVTRVAPAAKAAAAKSSAKPAKEGAAKVPALKKPKGLEHVVSSLRKTASKPGRQAGLLAMIKSLIGSSATEPAVHATLDQLKAKGKVSIDETGKVSYTL